MVRPLRISSSRHGAAAVELAVLMLFLVPILLVGIWEVGRMTEVSQIMSNAVREGGRQAATGQLSDTQVIAVVQEYIANEGLPTANLNVTVTNLGFPSNPTPPDNNPQNATDLDQLQVQAYLPYADVAWIGFHMVTTASTKIYGTAQWSSMKDRSYPVPTPPAGN